MKKTLITLAALAMGAVASAASLTDATQYAPGTKLTTAFSDTTNGQFTMTFVVDWQTAIDTFLDYNSKTVLAYSARNDIGYGDVCKSQVKIFNVGGILYAGIAEGGADKALVDGGGATFGDDTYNMKMSSDTYNVDGKLVLTFMYSDKVLTLSALKKDNTLGKATFTTGWTTTSAFDRLTLTDSEALDAVYLFDSAIGDDALAVSQAALAAATEPVTPPSSGDQIPEPTTATLSLLALAGLCARRRRK